MRSLISKVIFCKFLHVELAGRQVVIGGVLLVLPGEILRGWVQGGVKMDHRNLVHTLEDSR